MTKTALITGITGQDGSYLAELLLEKGYEVHGLARRASTFNTSRIDHIYVDSHEPDARFFLHYGDLTSSERLADLIHDVRPDEIYHLAAQSHVAISFDAAEYTGEVTGLGATRLLEATRRSGIETRFYQASSSEMFGNAPHPQNESTPFSPRSPYACAKVYAYWMTASYRDGYNLFACNGILFNHESPRRGEMFVTRKITRAIAGILAGTQRKLFLGNLDAQRDWGYAPDYVEAMWLMLQHDNADDYVIGTGISHSVRDFLDAAFSYVDLDWNEYVEIDPRYVRPIEVNRLVADASKARRVLGWEPRVTFESLVKVMVDTDMEAAGLQSPGEGSQVLERLPSWASRPGAVQGPGSALGQG